MPRHLYSCNVEKKPQTGGFWSQVGRDNVPRYGMNPCSETRNRALLAVFNQSWFVSPSRRRGPGKRTAFEPSTPASFEESLSWSSLFSSSTTNSTVAPEESADFVRPLSRSNSSEDR